MLEIVRHPRIVAGAAEFERLQSVAVNRHRVSPLAGSPELDVHRITTLARMHSRLEPVPAVAGCAAEDAASQPRAPCSRLAAGRRFDGGAWIPASIRSEQWFVFLRR